MPELPEVESAVRVLRAVAEGRTIVRVEALHPATRRTLTPAVRRRLAGRRIDTIERRGKHQLLRLDDGSSLHVHFRMAGDWNVGRAEDEMPRHARVAIVLDDGSRAALVDPRALCTARLHPPGDDPFDGLGPEATDPSLRAAWMRPLLARRSGPIKPALLDQRLLAGVGNIYASEALWHARIDPRVPASSLSVARLDRLLDGVRLALDEGSRREGRYSEGVSEGLRVYGREGEPCPRCRTPIVRVVQTGRSTFYCPRCQRR